MAGNDATPVLAPQVISMIGLAYSHLIPGVSSPHQRLVSCGVSKRQMSLPGHRRAKKLLERGLNDEGGLTTDRIYGALALEQLDILVIKIPCAEHEWQTHKPV